jgi:hypothetical protein
MGEKDIFREALNNFTFDVASGGAIAHLADLGFTPSEIQKRLDFPTPYEQVREAYLKWLLDKKIIVEDRAEFGRRQEKRHFVTEYDDYGHKSFRLVVEHGDEDMTESDPEKFENVCFAPNVHGSFGDFLKCYCCGDSNGNTGKVSASDVKNAYVSCNFGIRAKHSPQKYSAFLAPLEKDSRLFHYVDDIPWQPKEVWHLLDERMRGIIAILYEQSSYHGTILLFDKRQQIQF